MEDYGDAQGNKSHNKTREKVKFVFAIMTIKKCKDRKKKEAAKDSKKAKKNQEETKR